MDDGPIDGIGSRSNGMVEYKGCFGCVAFDDQDGAFLRLGIGGNNSACCNRKAEFATLTNTSSKGGR